LTPNSTELFNYLTERNYGKPHADKSIFHSPIVYIDKSEGRSNYRYYLISRFSSGPASGKDKGKDEKYLRYKKRLKKISFVGTDKDVETKRRREQNILQDWLFEENSAHNCAICGSRSCQAGWGYPPCIVKKDKNNNYKPGGAGGVPPSP